MKCGFSRISPENVSVLRSRHALAELARQEPPHAERFQQPVDAVERAAVEVPGGHAVRFASGQQGLDVGPRPGIVEAHDAQVAAGDRDQIAVAADVLQRVGRKHRAGGRTEPDGRHAGRGRAAIGSSAPDILATKRPQFLGGEADGLGRHRRR